METRVLGVIVVGYLHTHMLWNRHCHQIFHLHLQLCEQFGLLHESKGQGKERFIEVRKMREDNSTQVVVEDHAIPSQRTPLGSLHKYILCSACRKDT